MKKMCTMTLFALVLSSVCLAEETAQAQAEELVAQAPSNGGMGCSGLPQDQQNFANQLMTPANKTMFCNKFSMDQRRSAMQMMGTPSQNGMKMTADQAVEQVAKKNNMMMAPPNSSQQPQQPSQRSGGCPVRTQ